MTELACPNCDTPLTPHLAGRMQHGVLVHVVRCDCPCGISGPRDVLEALAARLESINTIRRIVAEENSQDAVQRRRENGVVDGELEDLLEAIEAALPPEGT